MITGMNHVGIVVANMERSVAFYEDMLGMALLGPAYQFGGPLFDQVMALNNARGKICMMKKANVQLELYEFETPNSAAKDPNYAVSDRGISHFGINVEDIDATYEKMLAAGVRFHCPVLRFESGMKATYGRDPDGNVFELMQPPSND